MNVSVEDNSNEGISSNLTLQLISEMSSILNTGLDYELITICHRLIENGINPQLLAKVIQEMKKN